jgi:hypothetical protein
LGDSRFSVAFAGGFDILINTLFPMDKGFLVQLTVDLYRLTLLFPKKEPLRYKICEVADNILEVFTRFGPEIEPELAMEIAHDIDVLDGFFSVAKEQNWVSLDEILKVSQKYVNLKQEMEDTGTEVLFAGSQTGIENPLEWQTGLLPLENKNNQGVFDSKIPINNDERQKQILEVLKEKGKGQVWEFKEIFPEVSKRTLRRDFEHLLSQGLVERIGERNQTFYQLRTLENITTI